MAQITVEEFKNFFKYYKGELHQQLGVEELYKEIDCMFADHLDSESKWIKQYRNQVEEETPVVTPEAETSDS